MERTFFPRRRYWVDHFAAFSLMAAMLVLWLVCGRLLLPQTGQTMPQDYPVFYGCILAGLAVYLPVEAVYIVLAYFRKRLVIREDEVRSHGALLVRGVRFAEVIEAEWLWLPLNKRERHYGLRLRTATKGVTIYFDPFVQQGAADDLIAWFRQRLGPDVRQIWSPSPRVSGSREIIQAVREGRASYWGPTVFTLKKMSRMLAFATGLAAVVGAAIGFLLQISPGIASLWAGAAKSGQVGNLLQIGIPAAAEHLWSGSLPLDCGLSFAFVGLVVAILFLSFFWFLEWTGRKWRIMQGRRLERAISLSPDSRGG